MNWLIAALAGGAAYLATRGSSTTPTTGATVTPTAGTTPVFRVDPVVAAAQAAAAAAAATSAQLTTALLDMVQKGCPGALPLLADMRYTAQPDGTVKLTSTMANLLASYPTVASAQTDMEAVLANVCVRSMGDRVFIPTSTPTASTPTAPTPLAPPATAPITLAPLATENLQSRLIQTRIPSVDTQRTTAEQMLQSDRTLSTSRYTEVNPTITAGAITLNTPTVSTPAEVVQSDRTLSTSRYSLNPAAGTVMKL